LIFKEKLHDCSPPTPFLRNNQRYGSHKSRFSQSLFARLAASFPQLDRDGRDRHPMEDAMFKQLLICAALIAFGTGSLSAQEHDLVLRKVEVPGAGFDIVIVMSKSKAPATIGLRGLDNPLMVHPIGDELAFAADSEVEKMFRGVGSSQYPLHAFRVERKDSQPWSGVNVYVVPKGPPTASSE
jgi:hypothetical protein